MLSKCGRIKQAGVCKVQLTFPQSASEIHLYGFHYEGSLLYDINVGLSVTPGRDLRKRAVQK